MSFFSDILKNFNLTDVNDKLCIYVIFGVGLMMTGNIKILELSDSLIKISENKEKYIICGENLILKSISKGEIVIAGEIIKIEKGDNYEK